MADAPITVMQALTDPRSGRPITNPYTRLLVESLDGAKVRTVFFRWSDFLTDRFDVLHVHWPEVFVRHPRRGVHYVKCLLLLAFLARIKLQKKAVVRTVHNLTPHEPGSKLEAFVLGRLDRATTVSIILNESTPTPADSQAVLVPHGHYRGWHPEAPAERTVPGRLLTFGLIRAYKGVDDLVRAFRATDDADLTLHISGKPDSAETTSLVTSESAADPRITLDLRYVPDDDLNNEIAESEAVVLPYREVHNSGAALLALSANRPVIMRRSASTELLQNEFGNEWVVLFDDALTAASLHRALENLRATKRSGRVDMSSREWPLLAAKTETAYRLALRLT